MAEFYWIGGSLGTAGSYTPFQSTEGATGVNRLTWVRAFDWNNPGNWRERLPTNTYTQATRSPSNGDIAVFGTSFFAPYQSADYLRARAACLFGGASAAGATVTWIGGGSSGANFVGVTFNSSLDQIRIEGGALKNSLPNGDVANYRPKYIGGGLSGENSIRAILETAQINPNLLSYWGITGSPASATEDTAIIGQMIGGLLSSSGHDLERTRQLRLKTNHIQSGTDATGVPGAFEPGVTSAFIENQGTVNISVLPNYAFVGSGATAMTYIRTTANLRGTPHYLLSGKFLEIKRYGLGTTDVGALVPTPGISAGYGLPRPHLSLLGVTAGTVLLPEDGLGRQHMGRWYFNDKCNFGKVSVRPRNRSILVELDGCGFNRDAVLNDLGLSGGSGSAGIIDENFKLEMVAVTPSAPQFPGKHGVYIGRVAGIGMSSAGITANWMKVDSFGLTFSVANSFSVNQLDLVGSALVADISNATNKYAKINTINLDKNSVIDFRKSPNFNSWEFGYYSGSAIQGGIVAKDEGSYILTSQGVRLFNEQLISSLRLSGNRSGTKVSTSPTVIGEEYI